MNAVLVGMLALTLLTGFAGVAAADPLASAPPIVGACVDGSTGDCHGDNWICVTISQQVPACVPKIG